jgi:predicted ATPase
MSNEKLAEQFFDVVNQFNDGAALVTDPDEIERVADLNLRAGRKAKASTAYASASRYLSAGLALMGPSAWATRPDLAFGLTIELAECAFLSSHFDKADGLVTELLQKANSKVDKAAAYRLKVGWHVVQSDAPQAVASALECLRLFDIDMCAHPSRDEVQEYKKIWRNLGDRTIENLIDLPSVTDPEPQAAMQVLAALIVPAYHTDSNLFDLQICQFVNLTLTQGLTDVAMPALGCLGWILCHEFRRYDEGYRFAKLAVDLIEKRGFVGDPITYRTIADTVAWTRPIATSIGFDRTAFRKAVETFDITLICFSAHKVINRLIAMGVALDKVWQESERFMDLVGTLEFRDGADLRVRPETSSRIA